MWLYATPLNLMGTAILTLGLLLWAVSGQSPLALAVTALRVFLREPRFVIGLAGLLGLLGMNRLETWVDVLVAGWVPWDLTEWAARAGGDLLLWIQQAEWAPLTHLFTFVYVILFPLLVPASFFLYAGRRDWEAFRHLLVSCATLYLTSLPFFILVPVREAWATRESIRFLIPQLYPSFEEQFRPHSGLDNCFPSFHTSVSVLCTMVAWRLGYRRLATVLGCITPLVMFSTLYLGVHWVPDMVAGLLLAVAVGVWVVPRRAKTCSPG